MERHHALNGDNSAAAPAPPLNGDTAEDVSGGSPSAESTATAEGVAAISTTVRASEDDGMLVVVAQTDGRVIVGEAPQAAELSSSQPFTGEQPTSPAAIEDFSHATVAEQPSAAENRQHAAADDVPSADASRADPAVDHEALQQGLKAAVDSEAASQIESEREAGEVEVSARPADRLDDDSLQRTAPGAEPQPGAISVSDLPVSPAATEPVTAAQQPTDMGSSAMGQEPLQEPPTPEAASMDSAVERGQESAGPVPAADEEASPSEAADAVSQRQQTVERPSGAAAEAPDSSPSLEAELATELADVRQHIEVRHYAERIC